MPLIEFNIAHNRTEADARARLVEAVDEVKRRYGPLIRRVDWSPDGGSVTLDASGAITLMRVDASRIHAEVDVPIIGKLLGGPFATGIKTILQKQLAR